MSICIPFRLKALAPSHPGNNRCVLVQMFAEGRV